MSEHEKLQARLFGPKPPRESNLAALLRIHRIVNDFFTMAPTELLTTDLDLLERLIMHEHSLFVGASLLKAEDDARKKEGMPR